MTTFRPSDIVTCSNCGAKYLFELGHECNLKIDRECLKDSAFSTQVGGNHYKDYPIQPYEFFFKNNIPHHKAAIIRRILRYDHPTGKGLEDLNKIKHEIDLIIELSNFDG